MKIINNILKFLYGGLFFLTPLFFTSNTSELFEFNKMIFIYILTILIGFFWLIKMIVSKKIIFKKTFLDTPIFLFFGSQLFSTFFSIDRHTSLFGYYGRFNGGLLSIISYIILYYGFVSNSVGVNFILKTSLFSSIAVMVYGLPGKLGHDLTCFFVSAGRIFDNSCWSTESNVFNPRERLFSTLGQPNWLGAYLAINFFLGIYFLIKNKNNTKYFIINFLYLFTNISFILFTRSRSALMAVGVGLILFIIYYLLFIKSNNKKLIITLLIISIIPILLFKTGVDKVDKYLSISNIKNSIFIKTSMDKQISKNNVSSVTESADIRKIVWRGAIDLGLKYPFFGTGVETFAYSYYFFRPVEHNLVSEWDYVYNKAHNEFLNYLATTGFFGLLTYLILITVFIVYVILKLKSQILNLKTKTKIAKAKKDSKNLDFDFNYTILHLSLLCAYITILITNFFGFSTTIINLFFYIMPAFVILASERNLHAQNQNNNSGVVALFPPRMTYKQWVLVFFILSISIYLLFSTFTYWLADTYYALGINYSKPQILDYQKAAGFFEKALRIRYEPIYEDRFSSALSYLSIFAAYQKQNDLAYKLIRLSDYYNDKTLSKYPKNIFYWKTKAKNQYLFYQVTLKTSYLLEGVKALKESKKISPTDPKIPYSLAVYYSLLYDSEKNSSQKSVWKQKSLQEINLALDLKKDFQDGLTLKKDLQKKYLPN